MNEFVIEDLRREVERWIEEVGVLTVLSCISDVCAESCSDSSAFPNCADFKCRVGVEVGRAIWLSTAKSDDWKLLDLPSGQCDQVRSEPKEELQKHVLDETNGMVSVERVVELRSS